MAGSGAFEDNDLSNADVMLSLVPNERRLVCIPIKQFEQRAISAVEYGLKIPAARHCAVHVARDRATTQPLAIAWMEADPPAPLLVVDDVGGLVPSVISALEPELVVVLGVRTG